MFAALPWRRAPAGSLRWQKADGRRIIGTEQAVKADKGPSLAHFLRWLGPGELGGLAPGVEIVVLIVIGVVVGFLVDTLTPGRIAFGWLLGAVLGIVGAAVGGFAFGNLDFAKMAVGGLAIVPAVIGAAVLALVAKLLILAFTRRPRSPR